MAGGDAGMGGSRRFHSLWMCRVKKRPERYGTVLKTQNGALPFTLSPLYRAASSGIAPATAPTGRAVSPIQRLHEWQVNASAVDLENQRTPSLPGPARRSARFRRGA